MTWPTKTDFVDGDVLTAAQVNNIGTNLNEADPTGITDGYVLTADGAGGMGWEAIAADSMTVISSGTLSTGTGTLTLSSIPGTYKDLVLYVRNFRAASSGANARIQFNAASGTVYWQQGLYASGSIDGGSKSGQINVQSSSASNTQLGHCMVRVFDYAQACPTNAVAASTYRTNAGGNMQDFRYFGLISDAAITRMDFTVNFGNFGAGDYVLYGVN